MQTVLPAASMVLAICAHPDDESFGLGAVLDAYAAAGARAAVLCFTAGEASTLGSEKERLATGRARELAAASAVLGLARVELLAYPDGALAAVPVAELAGHVRRAAADLGVDLLLVFDEGGITAHPDHCRATEAALVAAQDGAYRVLAWAIPKDVADALNREFGTRFVGRDEAEIDTVIRVDRSRQGQAIACHRSQATQNPVLWRRLELLGDREWLRVLPASRPPDAPES
jgi:LmbE family N-acetylglucosaminyl deacetylase